MCAFVLAACGGSGGPTSDGGDTTPPPAPNLALITVSAPQGGSSLVRGAPGAVEANATVRITNVAFSVQASGQAGEDGSFQVSVAAQFGDGLEIVAIDGAGNVSPKVETTAGPPISSIQLRAVAGDGQVGVAGRALTDSFRVRATVAPTQNGIPGLAIVFEPQTPGGSFSPTRVVTNGNGDAASLYTLGPAEGVDTLIAKLEIAPANQIKGSARAVGPPQITSVSPTTMTPGQTVTINGLNFSPISTHNVVLFGLERGTVTSATSTQLRVVVPPFATEGRVTVTLTGVTANTVNVTINPAVVQARPLGDVRLLGIPPSGNGQITLPFANASQEFTLVIQSLQTSASLNRIRVLGNAGAMLQAGRGLTPAALAEAPIEGESYIRAMERELLRGLPRGGAAARALAPAQELGSTRQFWVVNKPTAVSLTDRANFDRVTATLRYSGDKTLIYVDSRANHTLTDVELTQVGDRFDDQTYGADIAAFGQASDIDANGKVVILLSPTVNFLTTPDILAQGTRILGFFFGTDLLPDPTQNPHANDGEVFYGVVPNENNEFTGAPVSKSEIVELLNSVFAHEFEHMISFNQHILVRNGQPEALWLDEGLAHMAESLNGFHTQNRLRSAFFLDSPADVSLVAGADALDKRGAAWLMVQYLVDRFGQAVLGRLVQTNLTSTTNVASAAGRPFLTLFHEWASALLLDGPQIPNDPVFELPSVTIREDFERSKQEINPPGEPPVIRDTYLALSSLFIPGNVVSLEQRGTSALYIAVTSRGRANVPVSIDGQPGATLQVSVIRTK